MKNICRQLHKCWRRRPVMAKVIIVFFIVLVVGSMISAFIPKIRKNSQLEQEKQKETGANEQLIFSIIKYAAATYDVEMSDIELLVADVEKAIKMGWSIPIRVKGKNDFVYMHDSEPIGCQNAVRELQQVAKEMAIEEEKRKAVVKSARVNETSLDLLRRLYEEEISIESQKEKNSDFNVAIAFAVEQIASKQ